MSADTISYQDADYDLPGLERLAWEMLSQGAQSGRDAFHTGVLSSLSHDDFPASRTMVLRQVDTERRLLASYGDARAPKNRTLQQHPRVSWVFYDVRRRVELRVMGKMRVFAGAGDSLAEAVWASLPAAARHAFAGEQAPGAALDARAPSAASPTAEQMAARAAQSFGNFAVLLTFVERLEFLFLHHTGHHRARFVYKDEEPVERAWIST